VLLGVLLVGRRDPVQPAVEVVGRDLAQHGVDELRPAVPQHHPGQLDRRADRGVPRDTGAEQLMGAEREHVQHGRVHLAQGPVHALGDDRVVGPLAAQRAVDQLGGERRVPRVDAAFLRRLLPRLAQHGRKYEVGVRVPLVHGAQRLEGENADGVLAGAPVGLATGGLRALVGTGTHV
jgi:hypothetical protein